VESVPALAGFIEIAALKNKAGDHPPDDTPAPLSTNNHGYNITLIY